uniref:Derlin n=1 Tax=Quercus lobata TaxID=97700 RepID=A0A7N2MK68_QUELO
MGGSLVFMLIYVWSREYPNALIDIYRLVSLKGFYLPYVMLAFDLLLGNPLMPHILGMVVGHLYYFLTVLHPLAGGKFILKTPFRVHKLVSFWGKGTHINAPVQRDPSARVAFRGRSYRLNRNGLSPAEQAETDSPAQAQQPNLGDGVAFRGQSHRLNGR